jgi:hypothetical protein
VGTKLLDGVGVVHRGDAGALDERGDTGMRHFHKLRDRIARAFGHHQPAETPTGHHRRLGEAVANHHAVARLGNVQKRWRGRRPIVNQARVDLVGDQPHTAATCDVQYVEQLIPRGRPTGRVVRGVQDEGPRALEHPVEPIVVHAEAAAGQRRQGKFVHLRAPQARRVANIRPGWAMEHHTITGTHRRGLRNGDRGHTRRRDLNALLRDRSGVQLRQIFGERHAEFRQATDVGIACVIGLQCRNRRGTRRTGAGLVGFAETQEIYIGCGESDPCDLQYARAR